MDFLSALTIIGVIQGLFLSINLLIPGSGKALTPPKLFLGLLIFFLCLHCIDSFLTHSRLYYDYPHFFAVKDPFVLLYGPLLLLYMQSVIKHNFKPRWQHLFHLVPFIVFFIRIAPLYLKSTAYKLAVLENMFENYTNVRDIEINMIFNIHVFIYMIATLFVLFRAYRNDKLRKPFFKANELRQISIVVITVFIIYTVNIIRFWTSYDANTVLWMPLVIVILFFIIGYRSLQIDKTILVDVNHQNLQNYDRSVMLLQAFDTEMKTNKSYLNPDVSLNSIADQIQTNRQYLSGAINDIRGQSFTKYINQFRVAKAKELLASPGYKMYSLEKIAQDSGFNSLSTFQRAFREFEGISPSKFRAKNQVNL